MSKVWTIWIEHNDKVFNHEQWHETKVKHQIWEEIIYYAMAAWKLILEDIKVCRFLEVAILLGFDKIWGARNVLCRCHNLHIEWNWKRCGS